MITIKQIRGAKNYFENYLYYSQGENAVSRWRGKLAEMLGIEGKKVTSKDFEALGNNLHPITGEKLRPRLAKVQFHDVVISVPKSYSIAELVGKDERLIEGFQHAAEETFRRLEKNIAVRDRAGDAYNTENYFTTGNGAAAIFLHDDNRMLDPQLHIHVVLSNHSFSPEKDGYLALQPKIMMDEAKRWITDQFHRDLAKVARDAGYKVALPNNRLRLTGIGLRIEYLFSKRTQQRRGFEKRYRKIFASKPDKKRVECFIKEGKSAAEKRFRNEYQGQFGELPTREQIDEFVVDWRSQKKMNSSAEEKYLYQRSQLSNHDAKRLDGVVADAREKERNRQNNSAQENETQSERPRVENLETLSNQPEAKLQNQRKRKQNGESRKKLRQKKQVYRNSIGQREAIRRMRRGMAVARALQGHPALFLLKQISALQRKNDEQNRRNQRML